MEFEVSEDLVVTITFDGAPLIVQSTYPDGNPFLDKADATAWAEGYLAAQSGDGEITVYSPHVERVEPDFAVVDGDAEMKKILAERAAEQAALANAELTSEPAASVEDPATPAE